MHECVERKEKEDFSIQRNWETEEIGGKEGASKLFSPLTLHPHFPLTRRWRWILLFFYFFDPNIFFEFARMLCWFSVKPSNGRFYPKLDKLEENKPFIMQEQKGCLLSFFLPSSSAAWPDWSFRNFRSPRSGDWLILCLSWTSWDGFLSSKIVKGSVGWVAWAISSRSSA